MRPAHSPRPPDDSAFWRGVARGLRSPGGRRGFDAGYNRAVWPGALGGWALLKWVTTSRVASGQPRLDIPAEIGVCVLGSLLAATAVALVTRLWRRSRTPAP